MEQVEQGYIRWAPFLGLTMLKKALNNFPIGKWFTTAELVAAMTALGYDPGKSEKSRMYVLNSLRSLVKQGYIRRDKPHTRIFWRRIKEIS